MGWVTPEFAKFGREYVASAIWKDPLGRLEPIQGRPLTSGDQVSSTRLASSKTQPCQIPSPPTKILPGKRIARIRFASFATGSTFRSAPMAGPLIYFVGNSLGLMPKATRKIVEQELDDWARLGVDGHFDAATPWYSYHETLREPAARLVGREAQRSRLHEQPDGEPPPADGDVLSPDESASQDPDGRSGLPFRHLRDQVADRASRFRT